eukprot:GCRY01003018.1.p1 GENE.GCRY01003018.1~~GCRY01003018.1.p1  ORF type:complete len:124 (-),score=2.90 GCRY01003018.1:5-376(-)
MDPKLKDYYQRTRRLPVKARPQQNEIRVSSKTSCNAIISRATKLLNKSDCKSVTLCGLGAVIKKTIDAALLIKEILRNTVNFHISTSTVRLLDDYEPLVDDLDEVSFERMKTEIKIIIHKQIP